MLCPTDGRAEVEIWIEELHFGAQLVVALIGWIVAVPPEASDNNTQVQCCTFVFDGVVFHLFTSNVQTYL